MSAALPCPFCGSMPVLFSAGIHQANMECPKCGAKLPASTGANRYKDAINAWNKRTLSITEKDLLFEIAQAADILELAGEIETHGELYTQEAERIRVLLERVLNEADG